MINNKRQAGFLANRSVKTEVNYERALNSGVVSFGRMKDIGKVKINAVQDMSTVLAKASYKAQSSKVGPTTTLMEIASTNPKAYFDADGKIFNKELFQKVFKEAGKNNKVAGYMYKTIFIEGVNKFTRIDFAMGIEYTTYVVNRATIDLYLEELRAMDLNAITCPEDLAQIIIDLDPIARALQESAIDVVKDVTKDFGIYATDIVGSEVKAYNAVLKDNGITNNLDEMLNEKRFVGYEAKPSVNDQNCMVTDAARVQLAILKATNKFMGALVEGIAGTTNDEYKAYSEMSKKYPEFVYFIRKVVDTMVGGYDTDGRLKNEEIRMIRDAIYTEAKYFDVPVADVIKCGIAASYISFYTNKNGDIIPNDNIEKFRWFTTSKLFDDIFVKEYTENKRIDIELEVTDVFRFVEEGTVVNLIGGLGYDENHDLLLAVSNVNIDSTGVVKDGKLVVEYNPEDYVSSEFRVAVVDAFLTRENKEWKDIEFKDSTLKTFEYHIGRLYNDECGINSEGIVMAKNPETGKTMRIARLNDKFKSAKGSVNVKKVISNKRGAILILA
jgi:hypothetical protein